MWRSNTFEDWISENVLRVLIKMLYTFGTAVCVKKLLHTGGTTEI